MSMSQFPPTSGGGGAPNDATYITATSNASLTAERVATSTATVAWDVGTAGQLKANVPDSAITTTKLGGDVTAAGKTLLTDIDSDAQRLSLGAAPLASPTFTGVPAAPTAAPGTNTTQLATTAFVAASAALGQPLDAELTAIAGLTSAAGKAIEFTGSGTAALFDITTAGKALLDDANAAAQLVTLGAAPLASPALTGTPTAPTPSALDGSTKIATTEYVDDAAGTVGAASQPLDADLTAIAALTSAANKVPYATGAGAWALADFTAVARTLVAATTAALQRAALATEYVTFHCFSTSALGAGSTFLGHFNNNASVNRITVPAGKTFLALRCIASIRTGTTVGANYDCRALVDNNGANATLVQVNDQSNDTTVPLNVAGTEASPLFSVAAGQYFRLGFENVTGSTGAWAAGPHMIYVMGIFV